MVARIRKPKHLCRYPVSGKRDLVQVNTYRIPLANLPQAFDGFTIVHLTDLHHGPFVSRAFLERVFRVANSIPRHLTVCTGDYIRQYNSATQINRIWPLLASLHSPYGVFSILGNHDHWGDTARSIYWLDRTEQNLRHRAKVIEYRGEKLWFVGAGDLWEDHVDLDLLSAGIPHDACKIVLAHNPDTADTDFETRFDLMIAGHTHGGQVNLSQHGGHVLPVKNKTYSSGLKRSKRGLPVFISRGIGWSVVPVRFKCFPEIAVLKLSKAA